MPKTKPVHKSHKMGQEIDPVTPENPNPISHRFCVKCLLCSCHDQKFLYKKCEYEKDVYNA
jgi:hypothetical protein